MIYDMATPAHYHDIMVLKPKTSELFLKLDKCRIRFKAKMRTVPGRTRSMHFYFLSDDLSNHILWAHYFVPYSVTSDK